MNDYSNLSPVTSFKKVSIYHKSIHDRRRIRNLVQKEVHYFLVLSISYFGRTELHLLVLGPVDALLCHQDDIINNLKNMCVVPTPLVTIKHIVGYKTRGLLSYRDRRKCLVKYYSIKMRLATSYAMSIFRYERPLKPLQKN